MKRVTLWYRKVVTTKKRTKFEFNHLQDNWPDILEPEPVSKEQKKAWEGDLWIHTHAYLTEDWKVTLEHVPGDLTNTNIAALLDPHLTLVVTSRNTLSTVK